MSDPYIGEIKLVSFNFPPKGWAFCNGQLLPINQNQALFSILGTFYGGNGQTNFALPNLQGRVALAYDAQHPLGEMAGEELHTLTLNELPAHNHLAQASDTASNPGSSPAGAVWAQNGAAMFASASDVAMAPGALGSAGGGQAHENRPPYLVLNYIIALQGIFPSQN
ncbi:MAG: phage tail protein [Jatrophihabitans sp.]|uniref:phage tail protein n=1 Tax=Jatrophihabitans sp. TaxID=1932789 RepID=UPI003F7F8BD7